MGSVAACAALSGFLQFGLGIALLILTNAKMRKADSCIYDRSDYELRRNACDSLMWLAFLTVMSSLIISVAQGACSLLVGVPARCVEVLLRWLLACCWVGLSIILTIATVKADRVDHSAAGIHWRHVGQGLSWAMTALAIVFSSVSVLGLCCVDLPLLACCCPCCCRGRKRGQIEMALCDNSTAQACLEATGLVWLIHKWWPRWSAEHAPQPHYQPLAPDACMPPQQQLFYHDVPTAPVYSPPTIFDASSSRPPVFPHVHTPSGRNEPLIAPVYAPFSQGPAPPTVGWGVPVERAGPFNHMGARTHRIHPPNSLPAPPAQAGAWLRAPEPAAAGYAGSLSAAPAPPAAAWWPNDNPSSSRLSQTAKEGYEAPSAPPAAAGQGSS